MMPARKTFLKIPLGPLGLMLLLAPHLSAAADGDVNEVARDERHVALSVRSEEHPFPGPYKVDVYLPPNYSAGTEAYRVLYVFDGADLSPQHNALLQEGLIYPAILVSIQNKSLQSRIYDLTPSRAASYRVRTGGLEAFGKLIVGRIKPYVDTHFRTLSGPAYTGIVGNSFGGLAACWLAYFQPDTFGLAACLEPSLWWNDDELLKRLQHDSSLKTPTRFWIMAADQGDSGMWRNAKRGAFALLGRGWREGDDLAFFQVHNGNHSWESCLTQIRDMLHFLLRKAPPQIIGAELTNCHGPQHEAIRLRQTGEYANAYLDLMYTYGLRTTAIAPRLSVADANVAAIVDPVLGQLYPVGPGWTTVSAAWSGRRASLAVQGFRVGDYERLPLKPTSVPIAVDGDLGDWGTLPFEKIDGDGRSAGFRFGVTYDRQYVYIGCRLKDDVWIALPSLGDSINQDGLEIRLDARPDPLRSIGRGWEPVTDFICLRMAPGETVGSMKIRRVQDGTPAVPEGLLAAFVRTADGYAAEVAIPAVALDRAQGGPWKEFRLNVCQCDLDEPSGKVRRIWWQPDWESPENVIASGTFAIREASQ